MNALLMEHVELFRLVDETETLVDAGPYQLPPHLHPVALREEELARAEGRPNDWHALVDDIDALGRIPLRLSYRPLLYSHIVALASTGAQPPTLTANVLVVDSERDELVIQSRSSRSRLYPSSLSIWGGGFAPDPTAGGDMSLAATARREFLEEAGRQCLMDDGTPRLLTRETMTGAVQMNFLGAVLIGSGSGGDSWEGGVERLRLDAVQDSLMAPQRWTPLGWACVMTWLAIGAPGASVGGFGGDTPTAIFDRVLDGVEAAGYQAPPSRPV